MSSPLEGLSVSPASTFPKTLPSQDHWWAGPFPFPAAALGQHSGLFLGRKVSVVDCQQPEELQQLLVVWLDEVGWLLGTVVL